MMRCVGAVCRMTGRGNVAADHGHAAHHSARSEDRSEPFRRIDAILQRDDRRVRPDDRADRFAGRFDIPQFDAEQHQIDNADFCRIGGRVRGMNVDRPALALDAEPIPPDGVEMRASSDKRHIIPRLGK